MTNHTETTTTPAARGADAARGLVSRLPSMSHTLPELVTLYTLERDSAGGLHDADRAAFFAAVVDTLTDAMLIGRYVGGDAVAGAELVRRRR